MSPEWGLDEEDPLSGDPSLWLERGLVFVLVAFL
jgi:hypothetical protein